MPLYRMTAAGEVEEVSSSDIENSGITMICSSADQARELFKEMYDKLKGKNLFDVLMEIPFDD